MVGGPSRTKKRKLSSASEENATTVNDINASSAAIHSATDTGGVEVAAPKEGPNNTVAVAVAVAAESKTIMTTTKTDPLKSKNDNNDEDEEEEVSC